MPAEQTNTTPVSRASRKADTANERSFRFPGSVNTICQTGADLSTPRPGINVRLLWKQDPRTEAPPGAPCCAEVFSDDSQEYAALGLWFQDMELVDFDGAFELPPAVACALRFSGYRVGSDFTGEEEPAPAEILPIFLHEAIDAFPILRGYREGIGYRPDGSAYLDDADRFQEHSAPMGSGALWCTRFICALLGRYKVDLDSVRFRLDSEHRDAAARVFERWILKGGF